MSTKMPAETETALQRMVTTYVATGISFFCSQVLSWAFGIWYRSADGML
jgi:hypothetical protein